MNGNCRKLALRSCWGPNRWKSLDRNLSRHVEKLPVNLEDCDLQNENLLRRHHRRLCVVQHLVLNWRHHERVVHVGNRPLLIDSEPKYRHPLTVSVPCAGCEAWKRAASCGIWHVGS